MGDRPKAARDLQAVLDAIGFADRWGKDFATWSICLEFILNEKGYDSRRADFHDVPWVSC
jgi:hypothetical protein